MKKQLNNFQKLLIVNLLLAITVTGFYACKKNLSNAENKKPKLDYSVKKESKILNLSSEFKNTNTVAFLEKIEGLDIENGTLSVLNETDSITFYKFYYKDSEKVLVLYYFKKSDRFVLLNIEHKIDLINKNNEEIILSDYRNSPIVIEKYQNKVFTGFSHTLSNSQSKKSSNQKTMVASIDDDFDGAGETCYQCINRNYQASIKKCSDDMLCDLVCSINISCKVIFAVSALAVCTSPMDRPCSPIKRTYE